MEFLRSLWPNSSSNVITIPQHIEGELEDDLDLKVKSLIYLYKRLDIENLPPFINDENGIYDFKTVDNGNEKLDTIYNRVEFERQLIFDEHRILIDWFKNRFRSFCILSDEPSFQIESKLGKNFQFVILRANSSDEEYIETLITSDLYIEHSIDNLTKTEVLKEIIQNQKLLKPSYKKHFNKNDRAIIILQYLRKLSELIQVERIYKATLINKLELFRSNKLGQIKESIGEDENSSIDDGSPGVRLYPSNTRSRSRSPIRRRYSNDPKFNIKQQQQPLSPIKLNANLSNNNIKLTPPSSPIKTTLLPTTPIGLTTPTPSLTSSPTKLRSRSNSPNKSLKKKQSMTILKLDNSLNQSHENLSEDEWISKEEMQSIRLQSEQAVLFRIERERIILKGE